MQAFFSTWRPPGGVLGRIIHETIDRVAEARKNLAALRNEAQQRPQPRSFRDALRRSDVAVIAEVKRRSPSSGAINEKLDADKRARAYVEGGAAAISVVTEPSHFGGSAEDLRDVCATVAVPVLRKDFIVDEVQLFEARTLGASAALIIARALPPSQLADLAAACRAIGLEPLVEVRDEAELGRALDCDADVIGVNSRDLETLVVDAAAAASVLRAIPAMCVAVAESGVLDVNDVRRAAEAGADAVLVGSGLSAATEPTGAVRALTGIPVRRDGRRG